MRLHQRHLSLGTAASALIVAVAALVPAAPVRLAVVPLERGPMQTFDESCARCHGTNGENYGTEFGRHLSDSELRKVTREMADGPGAVQLDTRELDAQVALHRAWILREPFVAWVKSSRSGWSGEVSPGTKLTARAGGKPIAVKMDGTRWSISKAATAPVLTARVGSRQVTLDLAKAAHTHTKPLPKSKTR